MDCQAKKSELYGGEGKEEKDGPNELGCAKSKTGVKSTVLCLEVAVGS